MANCVHWVKWEDCEICNPKKKANTAKLPQTRQEREAEAKRKAESKPVEEVCQSMPTVGNAVAPEPDYTVIKDDPIRSKICELMSEMLDNPDEHGIYPTSRFMSKMEDYILQFKADKDEIKKIASSAQDEAHIAKTSLKDIRATLGDFQEEWSERESKVDAMADKALKRCDLMEGCRERTFSRPCHQCKKFRYAEVQPFIGQCVDDTELKVFNGIAWTCTAFDRYVPEYVIKDNGNRSERLPDYRIIKDVMEKAK